MNFVEAIEAIRAGRKVTAAEMLRDREHWQMGGTDRHAVEVRYYTDGKGTSMPHPHAVIARIAFETDMIYWRFRLYEEPRARKAKR